VVHVSTWTNPIGSPLARAVRIENLRIPWTGKHNRSFLCLPAAVRCHLYCYASLATDSIINLNCQPSREDQWLHLEETHQYLNLLLTCHTIYTEVLAVLYSINAFSVKCRRAEDLRVLQNLKAKSISLLTDLRLYLNVSSNCRRVCCSKGACQKYDIPLSSSSS
jgi:hypothetical protein